MTEYSEAFRERMVQKMSGVQAKSANALSKEVGVPQPTLSKWLREAATVASVAQKWKRSSQTAAFRSCLGVGILWEPRWLRAQRTMIDALRFQAFASTHADRESLYRQIVADYDTIRLVMVDGSLSPATGASGLRAHGAFASSTRDPCYGFLSIPKGVAVGVRCKMEGNRIEWGACDWGGWNDNNGKGPVRSTSGDIMHFHSSDLESTVAGGAAGDAQESPVFYVKKPVSSQ